MKPKDLIFWQEVKGKKSHFIFKQEDIYYIFTTKEGDTRGNFLIISQIEVDSVLKQLFDKIKRDTFHLRDIYQRIKGVDFPTQLKDDNLDYFISRLRNICYILVAKNYLEIVKYGRSIYFSKTMELMKQTKTSNTAFDKENTEKKYKKEICPVCNCKLKNENSLKKHLRKVHKLESEGADRSIENAQINNIPIDTKSKTQQQDQEQICPICTCKLKNEKNLMKHLKKVHEIENGKPEKNIKIIVAKNIPNACKNKTQQKDTKQICFICSCKLKNEKNLIRHLRKVHKIESHDMDYGIKKPTQTYKNSKLKKKVASTVTNISSPRDKDDDQFDYFNDYSAVKD